MDADAIILAAAAALLSVLGAAVVLGRRRSRAAGGRPVAARTDGAGVQEALCSGLSAMLAGDRPAAIEHLRRVVRQDTDAVEVYVLLGDLHRELGQVDRAVRIHRSILARSGLRKSQHAAVLGSLARDYEAAGFLDRALHAFAELSDLEPRVIGHLRHLRRLNERAGAFEAALQVQRRMVALATDGARERRILALLHDRVGLEAAERGDVKSARRHFDQALDADPSCAPPHLHLGDLAAQEGRLEEARARWLEARRCDPTREGLVLERLEASGRSDGDPQGILRLLESMAEERPGDWRVRAFLAERLSAAGRRDEAWDRLLEALALVPGAPAAHRAAWRVAADGGLPPDRARRILELVGTPQDGAPLTCLHCRYRTSEQTWRCPHCHRWDTFVADSDA